MAESFDLSNDVDGLTMKKQLTSYPIYTFDKSKTKFVASKKITKEFLDLLARYDEFIISVYIKPLRHSKGTLLWIQNKRTGKFIGNCVIPMYPIYTNLLMLSFILVRGKGSQ